MTDLFLLRHGEAESLFGGISDAMRNLTQRGRKNILDQAVGLSREEHGIQAIHHSPYTRAVQTAEIVNGELGLSLHVFEELTPSGSVGPVVNRFSGLEHNILAVSHLPLIAELAQAITGRQVGFYPGTLVKINLSDPYTCSGSIEWVRHPR